MRRLAVCARFRRPGACAVDCVASPKPGLLEAPEIVRRTQSARLPPSDCRALPPQFRRAAAARATATELGQPDR